MDVFISWSGERSYQIAVALRDWLPMMMNAVRSWLSTADIDKGARWVLEVSSQLESSKFGVICLTPENLHSDWLLFEAGALSESLRGISVCPLLIDLDPSDIGFPLAQFQTTRANKEEIRNLVSTINLALEHDSFPQPRLEQTFAILWPHLEKAFLSLPARDNEQSRERIESYWKTF